MNINRPKFDVKFIPPIKMENWGMVWDAVLFLYSHSHFFPTSVSGKLTKSRLDLAAKSGQQFQEIMLKSKEKKGTTAPTHVK